jgi:chemotaxis protein MotD
MTIGADMPLRSHFEALVRDTGKGGRANDKNLPKEDSALEFKTMVKVALPKLKLDTDDAAHEETPAEPDETVEPDKNKSSAVSVQGVFGQTILAFEQLLERQREDQGNQAPAPIKIPVSEEPGSMITAVRAASPVTVDKAEGKEAPLPDDKTAKPAEASTKPMPQQQAMPAIAVQPPQEVKSRAVPAPAAAGDAVAEMPEVRNGSRATLEQPVAPATNTTPAPPPVFIQGEAKLAAVAAPVTPQPAVRPQVTDVQILSDRTTGAARTLVVQLQPIELGTVTARLRLTSEGMHIQLTAENRAMAEHLAKDHDALGKALQRAGVADDAASITISVIDRSSATSNTPAGQQNLAGQEQQTGARGNGQGYSGFQGTSDDRSTSQQPFGDILPDEREEKLAKAGIGNNLSRGLVV